ncbi:NlpC/P60 family protein [Streptomyces sp. NPDC004520]|uniref:NlpC/P60 family protein n=1 Tax=Streptomyces sp. NPDC004520 TaxID=3364702 RepID=UPI0036B969E6
MAHPHALGAFLKLRTLLLGASTGVGGPVALGMAVMLVAAVIADDEDRPVTAVSSGALRVGGEGGVPAQYAGLIERASAACGQGLPAPVLAAQIFHESGWNPRAESRTPPRRDPQTGQTIPGHVIAQGISQFTPGTWATRGVDGDGDGDKDVFDPADAIPAQGRFMCSLLQEAKHHPDYAGSSIELALAGYNAGWGRVDEFRGVPPVGFARGETYHYVQRIMATSRRLTATIGGPGGPVELPAGFQVPADAPPEIRTAVAWALQQRGGWYQLGGDCTDAHGDSRTHWCDCSSLMQQAYRAAGVVIPRVTYDQVNIGRRVDLDAPRPGDLVFNAGSDGSAARPGHVGMYVGEDAQGRGLVVEAPRTGVRTRLVSYDTWRTSSSSTIRVTEIRRVVDW